MSEKKLYRARHSIGGGVCSGVAEYFKIDPVVIQIITVVLTLATGGLVALAYVALWVILPQTPDPDAPVEVEAREVHSDTYGPVEYRKQDQKAATEKQNYVAEAMYERYAGNAHTPPEPPKNSDAYTAQGTPAYSSTVPPTAQAVYEQAQVTLTADASHKNSKKEDREQSATSSAVTFGLLLLFVGLSALLGQFVVGVEWWQFWPLLLVIGGIGHMIVPGKRGHCKRRFVCGFMVASFGIAALPFSLGFISLDSLVSIFDNLWPVLLVMCGLFVLGGAMDTPLLSVLGCLCFVAFCVVGIGWFSYPGPTDAITLFFLPDKSHTFRLNFWL